MGRARSRGRHRHRYRAWALPYICALGLLFGLLMVVVVRPLLARFGERALRPTDVALVVAGILACACATSAIGVHEIFGAFLLGAVFPRGRWRSSCSTGWLRSR